MACKYCSGPTLRVVDRIDDPILNEFQNNILLRVAADQKGKQDDAVHLASVKVYKAPLLTSLDNRPEFPTPLFFSNMTTRAIYRGPQRKLVLAFDVGTTYSGISYR